MSDHQFDPVSAQARLLAAVHGTAEVCARCPPEVVLHVCIGFAEHLTREELEQFAAMSLWLMAGQRHMGNLMAADHAKQN